ncbi:murein biosynthesis integral membrane protein MurJ [Pseudonocardia sp. S2-4]|uniref:Murein biosynthesis integral membrane protein MurJ n=2 Tax=Pseudonocardia humida TaxID=2800819 RepID=A0ABT1ABD6_9PSEU|nr:murein biosynthesis integral membrane protein MurJ [Pseudonocardia humida]
MMAIANLTSRITGFVRQVALVAVLGVTTLSDAYTISNTLPNIVYELLIGGVLGSVLIPLLVRAQAEDADGGVAYTRRLLTTAGAVLLLITALALLAAPLLTGLYTGDASDPQTYDLALDLAYLLLPQIFFYGIGAIVGAVLNSKGAFGPFAWAPVLNNVVVLAMLGAYVFTPDEHRLLVLGLGTTLGIVAQTVVLLPSLRKAGFRYRPVWGWDPRLRTAGRLAGWSVLYAFVGFLGYLVTMRVAFASGEGAPTAYNNAWLLLQVPYGVLGVSLLTALMPRMSRAAAAGRYDDVVSDLSLGSRLAAVFLIPISALITAFGPEIGVALFGLRSANLDGATTIGTALAVSAFGLAPYAITLLQMRVFYAMTDSRTPTFVQLFTVGVKVALMLLCPVLLEPADVVLGLATANALSFVAGALLGQVLLRRRLGRLPSRTILGTGLRTLAAAVVGAAAARGVLALLDLEPMLAVPALGRAWTAMFLALVLGGPLILLVMRVLRVRETEPLLRRIDGIVDRLRARRGPAR